MNRNSDAPGIFKVYSTLVMALLMHASIGSYAQRRDILLNNGWRTVAADSVSSYKGFEAHLFNDKTWSTVTVPHTWDQYEGYRRLKHGNRHGYAWYRKTFDVRKEAGKRYFLFFEGVGSYATVWVNGKKVGYHAGGRTTFTLDITDVLHTNGGSNLLAVRADHPAYIEDLPWVCGGCSDDRGFSEGSQPMGIFRPVHLIITNEVRIEPFGVHIWDDVHEKDGPVNMTAETEIRNYSAQKRRITLINRLLDKTGKEVISDKKEMVLQAGDRQTIRQNLPKLLSPHLWSPHDPYLYTVVTSVMEGGKENDRMTTPYGVRWINWPVGKPKSSNQFFINGEPFFINGTAEYEHMLGESGAFSAEQIKTRIAQVKAAGFNAFRDAHQPHNLRYQKYWDSLGILWWPQLSAHIWYDTKAFRDNFKTLLREWIKERRNSPSVILWGLQNESRLPEDFAKECTALIREMDPRASKEILVTTCNGGSGTDWDVPQNWTGTYGGDPATYGQDLKRQILVGEYGAWRTLDLHTEGRFQQNGPLSEDRMTQLMEQKVKLAESVKDSTAGHFHWLMSSHDNPGRTQSGEGLRDLDRIGPVNYKGLFTPWGEPTDAFYMFRSNYADAAKEPMVYIVSHTWPDRWLSPGMKDSITVYSNCDEVELFNDINTLSLGKRKRSGVGTHFQWDSVNIQYNVLYAVGYFHGKIAARDTIVLHHLPKSPHFKELYSKNEVVQPSPGYQYIYRVNCGGPDYTDHQNHLWQADVHWSKSGTWGSTSWTDDFKDLPPYFASQRYTNNPVKGTADWPLFQTFRYGLDKLTYDFPVPDGDYIIELYFAEPWYGAGGGLNAARWRLFDVAVNGKTYIRNLDIYKEAGYSAALKKTIRVPVKGGKIHISFPYIASGQAIISAIGIASLKNTVSAPASPALVQNLVSSGQAVTLQRWLNTGDPVFTDGPATFSELPADLYGAEWLKASRHRGLADVRFTVGEEANVFVGIQAGADNAFLKAAGYAEAKKKVQTDKNSGESFFLWQRKLSKSEQVNLKQLNGEKPYLVFVTPVTAIEPPFDLKPSQKYEAEAGEITGAVKSDSLYAGKAFVKFGHAKTESVAMTITVGVGDAYAIHLKYYNLSGKPLTGRLRVAAADGSVLTNVELRFPVTSGKWGILDTSTGTSINAGTYKVILEMKDAADFGLDGIDIQ